MSMKSRRLRSFSILCMCVLSFIAGCTVTLGFLKIDDRGTDYAGGASLVSNGTSGTSLQQQTMPPVLLTALILSGPNNSLQREMIRQTWLSNSNDDLRAYFVIGVEGLDFRSLGTIAQENAANKDLLIITDLKDSYLNLTEKVIRAFREVLAENFRFLFKCDDDTFVNIPPFIKELKKLADNYKSLYWGFFRGNARVKTAGPWKETTWNLCDMYLPYALGGGYVLSRDLVTYIVDNEEKLRKFQNEDVTIGAWLATVKTKRHHDTRFDTEYRSRGCKNSFLVLHKRRPMEMRQLYDNILETKKLCSPEKQLSYSYQYNWDVLPSMCCVKRDKNMK